jgi:hypothetical protein
MSYIHTSVFDIAPQLTKPVYGPEPTLRKIIYLYYISHNIPEDKAAKFRDDYLKALGVPEEPYDPVIKGDDGGDLWDADPNCKHEVVDAPGGGVKCRKCGGWFCF